MTDSVRVLVVEDNIDNLDLIVLLLSRNGYEVITAQSGRLGLEKIRAEKPDVVLMDLSLPEMDGWTVAHMIKDDPALKDIPLIAVTAHTLPGDRRKALDAGFDQYISKPINVNLFDSVIKESLEKKK